MRFAFAALVIAILVIGLPMSSGAQVPPAEGASSQAVPLRITVSRDDPPFSQEDVTGEPAGMFIDLWTLWSQKTGRRVDFRMGTWNETLDALRTGAADIHGGLYYGQQRDKWIAFSHGFFTAASSFYRRQGPDAPALTVDLDGLRVGVVDGYIQETYLREAYPRATVVPQPDNLTLVTALVQGRVDLILSEDPTIDSLLTRTALHSRIERVGTPVQVHDILAGVRDDRTDLLDLINDGLARITEEERAAIEARWIKDPAARQFADSQVVRVELTPRERAWIVEHPMIRAIALEDWPPVDFRGSGRQHRGIAADILRLAAERVGLKVEPRFGPWPEMLEQLRKGAIDLAPEIYYTESRAQDLAYSRPYLPLYNAIFTGPGGPSVSSLKDLEGRTVAVEKGFALEEVLKTDFPAVDVMTATSTLDALRLLTVGEVDAYVGSQYVASYLIDQQLLRGLRAVAHIGQKPQYLHMAVPKDRAILRDIMDKALSSITDREKRSIIERYVDSAIETGAVRQVALDLTPDETAWLAAHPVIPIAMMNAWPPISYVEQRGNRRQRALGVTATLRDLLNKRLGNRLRLRFGAWNDNFEAVKEGRIPALFDITPRKDREQWFNFTSPYLTIPHTFFTRADGPVVNGAADLKGKTVALEKGFGNVAWFRENHPDVTVREYADTATALDAVARGEADAYAGNRAVAMFIIRRELMDNLRARGRVDKPPVKLAIGTRKDWPLLRDILDKAIGSLTEEELLSITALWNPDGATAEKGGVRLTAEERRWVHDHPTVTYSEVDWRPMSIIEGDRMVGVMGDYLDVIAQSTGLNFQFVPAVSWPDVLEKFTNGDIDIVPGIGNSASEARLGLVSKPYSDYPLVIVGRDDAAFVNGIEDLEDKVIAIPRYFTSSNYIKETFPQYTVKDTDTIEQALRLVSNGQADVFVGHKLVAVYNIESLYLRNLKIIGVTDFKFFHSVLVHPTDPVLLSILNKAIDRIDAKTKERIYDDWVRVSIEETFDYALMYKIGAAVLVIIVLGIFWSLRLKQAVNQKTREMRRLLESLEDMVAERTAKLAERETLLRTAMDNMSDGMFMVDDDQRYVFMNQRYRDYIGLDENEADVGGSVETLFTAVARQDGGATDDQDARVGGLMAWLADNESGEMVLHLDPGARILQFRKAPVEDGGAVVVVTDITDVTRAREELQQSEGELRLILESIGEGVFGVDGTGKVSFVNTRALDLLGYEADELIGQGIHELIHHTRSDGTSYPIEECPMWHAYTRGVSARVDDEVLWRKDGTPFPVDYTVTPIHHGGDIIGSVIAFGDVSQLAELNRNFVALLENTQDFIYITNADYRFTATSQTFAEATRHRSWRDLLGKADTDVIPEDSIEAFHRDLGLLLNGEKESIVVEESYRDLDGNTRWVESGKYVLRDKLNRIVGMFGISRDITDRRQAENRLRSIIDTASDGIAVIDDQGTIQMFSPAAERIFQYTAEEVVGRNFTMLMSAEHAVANSALLERYLLDLRPTVLGAVREVVGRRKNGELFDMELAVGEAVQGDTRTFTGLIRDITERKTYMAELEAFNRLAVDRELRMIELKEEINQYLRTAGKEAKYEIVQ